MLTKRNFCEARRFLAWTSGRIALAAGSGTTRLQFANGLRKLREPAEHAHGSQPLLVVECRRAAHHSARWNIAVRAALRRDDHPVADTTMSGYAYLAGK